MRAIGRVGLILVALLAPLATGAAWAQTEVGGWLLEGDVEAGFRFQDPTLGPALAQLLARAG